MGNPFQSVIDELNDRKARIATLEAENAALREGLSAVLTAQKADADHAEAGPVRDTDDHFSPGQRFASPQAYQDHINEAHELRRALHASFDRARALLQGGPDAG